MSTGNDNFITLDNIAEIQDIVSGDYLFTISNGVIYKLDFQNFIITKANTDFFTTIDSLSAQVVSNTQSLCAINAYINDEVKPNFSKLDSVYTTLNELSANWDSTYTTINTLSSQAFLPISNVNNNIGAGSMVYYDGNNNKFITLPPGYVNQVLTINKNGLPSFTSATSLPGGLPSGSTVIFTKTAESTSARGNATFPYDTIVNTPVYNSDTNFEFLQINFNTNNELSSDTLSVNVKVYANNAEVPSTGGVAVLNNVTSGTAIELRTTIKGSLKGYETAKITLNYDLVGEETQSSN